jgi:hypothetical protein
MQPYAPASATPSQAAHQALARQVRQRLVHGLCGGIVGLDKAVLEFLDALIAQTGTTREMQERRELWQRYRDKRQAWANGLARAWQSVPAPQAPAGAPAADDFGLSLLDDGVVENRITASRLAQAVTDAVSASFDAVRQRTQQLEGRELQRDDILFPETCCQRLVEQWVDVGLSRTDLQAVLEPLQHALIELLRAQYQGVNRLYDEQGVVVQVDLRARVRRPASVAGGGGAGAGSAAAGATTGYGPAAQASGPGTVSGIGSVPPHQAAWGSAAMAMPMPSGGLAVAPLLRARQRAQSMVAQLRRWLVLPPTGAQPGAMGGAEIPASALLGVPMVAQGAPGAPMPMSGLVPATLVGGGDPGVAAGAAMAPPVTQALSQALVEQHMLASTLYGGMAMVAAPEVVTPQVVVQVAGQVREQSNALKQKASTASEKATIEVVALMFQSILTEDRIPPAVRVWFARLQVPVLRVALAEPEFFSDLDHPARRLIDRMGACVMGFNAASGDSGALETEVRRIVQVIEQYPETGQRVFQLVYEEFEKFLAKYLTERQSTARLVSVAQQVEQRETLAIQYTIELRSLLKDMPVRDEIREFLFKTWAEVLALSAVRDGPQHPDTVAYKSTATDLVWAASAKPHRSDRAQVIQSLPGLLTRLRQGLTLLGMDSASQDAEIKILTDTLAQAFLSKTAAIAPEHIDAMARRLANLEDFMDDATLGDMPLSSEHIEMMLGIDASAIHVIADTGAPVQEEMLAWAQQLALGVWFTLDHNGASAQVQYAWHSERKQLHLFAAVDGSCYLIQLRRMAAYLQAGLLVPQDDEALTVRATRDALAKLDANPERLLN